MARKLLPNSIEWELKLNATQAQKEIHKLTKKNKAKTEQAARQEMARLESEGKKGSQGVEGPERKPSGLSVAFAVGLYNNSTHLQKLQKKFQKICEVQNFGLPLQSHFAMVP